MIKRFYEYYLPVLKYLDENGPTHQTKLKDALVKIEKLDPKDIQLTSDKGTNIFNSRIHWAVQYLYQSGALDRPAKATYAVNQFGRSLIKDHPNGINPEILRGTDGYKHWDIRSKNSQSEKSNSEGNVSGETPTENIETAIQQLENSLAHELVTRLREATPEFLERIILVLLGRMGYGDGEDSLEHLGGPGDEGLDGVINQDRLGLQRIYIQAKRYREGNNIGRPEVQKFMGALQGQGASGGVFITTSRFSQDAEDYVSKNMTPRIILIDGPELGRLLVKHEVGVVSLRSYKVLEIDENLFDETDKG
jgi:restriction system protein